MDEMDAVDEVDWVDGMDGMDGGLLPMGEVSRSALDERGMGERGYAEPRTK